MSSSFGFINTSGEFVVPPIYKGVAEFYEGRASVSGEAGGGYVTRDGREVIPCEFGYTYAFSEGFAVVSDDPVLAATPACRVREMREREKPMGYIDRAGHYVIPPAFITAREFSGGLAAVEYDVRKWGFIDPAGYIREVEADTLNPFVEGYARFGADDLREGFLDTELRVVIPPIYDWVHDFHEGFAWATEDISGESCHFLNPAGERALSFDVHCHTNFAFGRLAVRVGDRWGCVDKSGDMVISPAFESAQHGFYEGLADVQLGGRWGFIDVEGDVVVEPRFDEVLPFSDGLAAVRADALWGYVNATGELVIEPRFDRVWGFSEGLAPVQLGDAWGFVDATGDMVTEPCFLEVDVFREGRASAEVS
ncbi:WG repeat-containing protein [Candidatus Poribacteria bacterium]|nr:WG repeat-containing protein [Candidatus Poribacteria bacterium]MBT5534405.1 WG repeat-containing protein [Candidatus Poribacteria bacterium]MBT5712757.1 WG repeat-containing protein [Candidatus Poribacteria bacterium]MBT7804334.1 WG repeat-containing protein [Candidatus Poribacteria bacterium]